MSPTQEYYTSNPGWEPRPVQLNPPRWNPPPACAAPAPAAPVPDPLADFYRCVRAFSIVVAVANIAVADGRKDALRLAPRP